MEIRRGMRGEPVDHPGALPQFCAGYLTPGGCASVSRRTERSWSRWKPKMRRGGPGVNREESNRWRVCLFNSFRIGQA